MAAHSKEELGQIFDVMWGIFEGEINKKMAQIISDNKEMQEVISMWNSAGIRAFREYDQPPGFERPVPPVESNARKILEDVGKEKFIEMLSRSLGSQQGD